MGVVIQKKAFTLTEIIVVMIVIGVLAGLTIPNLSIQAKKVKNSEAMAVLQAVYRAQKEYSIDNNGTYASTIGALDLEIDSTDLKSFKNLIVSDVGTVQCGSNAAVSYFAKLDEVNDEYSLYILQDQTGSQGIVCTDCTSAICLKMGFVAF